MFTAVFVTRTFLRLAMRTPLARNMSLLGARPQEVQIGPAGEEGEVAVAPRPRRASGRRWSLDFVRRRNFYYLLTAALLVPAIVALLIPPSLKPGIEFTAGATFTVKFDDPDVTASDLRDELESMGQEVRVQSTSDGAYIIRTGELEGVAGPPVGPAPPSERDEIEQGLEDAFGSFEVTNFNQVSEIVSREIVRDASIAVGAAAIAILAYVSWTFRNVPKAYRYGIAAIVAAGHDTLIILGAFSIFGKLFGTEVNTMFITGLLTIIGFSVHDTIVVFDRIRETIAVHPDAPLDEVVNVSLTETLARSVNTSLTLMFTVVSLLLLGGETINEILLVMLIGVIAGTYSSIFVASQILVSWEEGDWSGLLRRLTPWRAVPASESPG
jgi:preprotein translocase subunit SecF